MRQWKWREFGFVKRLFRGRNMKSGRSAPFAFMHRWLEDLRKVFNWTSKFLHPNCPWVIMERWKELRHNHWHYAGDESEPEEQLNHGNNYFIALNDIAGNLLFICTAFLFFELLVGIYWSGLDDSSGLQNVVARWAVVALIAIVNGFITLGSWYISLSAVEFATSNGIEMAHYHYIASSKVRAGYAELKRKVYELSIVVSQSHWHICLNSEKTAYCEINGKIYGRSIVACKDPAFLKRHRDIRLSIDKIRRYHGKRVFRNILGAFVTSAFALALVAFFIDLAFGAGTAIKNGTNAVGVVDLVYLVTVTCGTIGYGDINFVGIGGRVIGSLLAGNVLINGVLFLAWFHSHVNSFRNRLYAGICDLAEADPSILELPLDC